MSKYATVPEVQASQPIEKMQSEEFSRVSPLAIIYFFAKTLLFIANNFVYVLPAFAFNLSSVKNNLTYVVMGAAGILLLVLIVSILKYLFYYYRFTDGRVEIKQGVFKKSHLDLPFAKIQNVKIVQPFYYRIKQYSYIELDTAGSAQQEAKIVALPLTLANSFKHLILQIKQAETQEQHPDSTASNKPIGGQESEHILNERSLKDLVIHGISNNRIWIILGFLAPFYNTIASNVRGVLDTMGFDIVAYLDYESQSMGLFLLHVLSLVMLIMLVMVSFSVIGSIFVFYKYQLSKQGDRYIRRSGLLTKHEVSMRLSRIQIAVQQQDWLDVLINRANLRFEQNSSGVAGQAQAGNINNASKLVVPSVTPNESIQLIQDAFAVDSFTEVPFLRISKRYMVRLFLFVVLPIVTALISIAALNQFSATGWIVVTTIATLLTLSVVLRWWRWGYHFDSQFVYIRKGLLGVNYQVFPIGKTQQVTYRQSIFMRKRKLASIQYVLASGAYSIPFMPEYTALQQCDEALLKVAKYKPAWM